MVGKETQLVLTNFIVCLDLFTYTGGIQRFNQVIFQAIQDIDSDSESQLLLLSLLDQTDEIMQHIQNRSDYDRVVGCGGNKLLFIWKVIKSIFQLKPERIILTHVHLAPLAILVHLFSPLSKVWVVLHGFEAWKKVNHLILLGLRYSYGLLSVSNFTKTEFHKMNLIPLEKIRVIYSITGPEWNDKVGLNRSVKDCQYILCVSRLEPEHGKYKGVDKTIEAIAGLAKSGKLGNFHLVVVGEGGDRKRLEILTEKLNICELVYFTGKIDEDDLRDYYANCSLFVLPSTKEGLGLVYLEAMAHAKPVIASRQGACSELVVDGQTGFLAPEEDVDFLAVKIFELISSEKLRQQFGEAGKILYLENFTYPKFTERLRDALNS